jgi:hypothetical protein
MRLGRARHKIHTHTHTTHARTSSFEHVHVFFLSSLRSHFLWQRNTLRVTKRVVCNIEVIGWRLRWNTGCIGYCTSQVFLELPGKFKDRTRLFWFFPICLFLIVFLRQKKFSETQPADLKQISLFLIPNFRLVLNVLCFLMGNSPAFEFYMPTFQKTLSIPSS